MAGETPKEYDTAIGKHFDHQINRMRLDLARVINAWETAGIPRAKIKAELFKIAEGYSDLGEETPGKGHSTRADQGQIPSANPRAPNGGGEGQKYIADKAILAMPSSSPTQSRDVGQFPHADKAKVEVPTVAATERSGGGHASDADKASGYVPPSAAPQGNGAGQGLLAEKAKKIVPRPVPAPPSAVAIRALADTNCSAAKIVLDLATWRVDGRLVAKMTIDEAYERGKAMAADGILLMLPKRHYANVNGSALVGDILNNRTLNDLVSKAKERANAAA